MKKLTPVLVVDAIEPCLPFWVERLGFTLGPTVPHGDALGFAILNHGPVELMLQTRASVADDLPALANDAWRSALYLEVDDLAPIRSALADVPLLVPERTTPYGARELGVRDPAGNSVVFAQLA